MPNASAGRMGRLSWLWLSVLVVVIDQASKFYFENSLSLYPQLFQLDVGLQHRRCLQLPG